MSVAEEGSTIDEVQSAEVASLREADPARTSTACRICRRRKVKCSGTRPCQNCVKNDLECIFDGVEKKRRYPESYVNGLLEQIKQLENVIEEQQQDLPTEASQGAPHYYPPSACEVQPTPQSSDARVTQSPNALNSTPAVVPGTPGNTGGGPETSSIASGQSLESHVKQLLGERSRGNISHTNDDHTLDSQSRSYKLVPWSSIGDSVYPHQDPPCEEEAQRLLDIFIFYLGISQHFFDQRSFSDLMALFYQQRRRPLKRRRVENLWYVEFLLVLAMGKLLDGEKDHNIHPPGVAYFVQAINRLPSISQLRKEGVLAVEVLGLITLYLQCCDQKEDAYVYVGLAIRVSMSLGLCQGGKGQQCLQSENAHRDRLWWTIYMLDRRIAAANGCPVGIDDQQILAALPTNTLGFPSPTPLNVNIRIARATGEIMLSLYSGKRNMGPEAIDKVQGILKSLYDTAHLIPPELSLDFSNPNLVVSRTGSSLYLMLFQAIILCVRPIVLHMVKSRTRQNHDGPKPQEFAPVLIRLCQTCQEAAGKSLRILAALQQQAKFGFFDLDATFSVAFVFVMIGIIDLDEQHKKPRCITEARQILQYLGNEGNEAAKGRIEDIDQMCANIWSSEENTDIQQLSMRQPFTQSENECVTDNPSSTSNSQSRFNPQMNFFGSNLRTVQRQEEINVGSSPLPSSYNELGMFQQTGTQDINRPMPSISSSAAEQVQSQQQQQQLLPQPHSEHPIYDGGNFFNDVFDLGSSGLENDILFMYNDPSLPLTGVDYSDWMEMERMILPESL